MNTVSCAAACIAHSVLTAGEETKKATQISRCSWQQNSNKLQKVGDRSSEREA